MQKLKELLPVCGFISGFFSLVVLCTSSAFDGYEVTPFVAISYCIISLIISMPFWVWNLLQAKRGLWWKSMITYSILSIPALLVLFGMTFMCGVVFVHNIGRFRLDDGTLVIMGLTALGLSSCVLAFWVFLDGFKRPKI